MLRFESSNQLGNRMTVEPVELGGIAMPPGTPVTLCIGAANRDPAQFADPENLDIGRTPNRHLAFGTGAHQCAGMALARLEGAIAISRFLARFPDTRSTASRCAAAGSVSWVPERAVCGGLAARYRGRQPSYAVACSPAIARSIASITHLHLHEFGACALRLVAVERRRKNLGVGIAFFEHAIPRLLQIVQSFAHAGSLCCWLRPALPGNRRATLRHGKPASREIKSGFAGSPVAILRQVATLAAFSAFKDITASIDGRPHGQGRATQQSGNQEPKKDKIKTIAARRARRASETCSRDLARAKRNKRSSACSGRFSRIGQVAVTCADRHRLAARSQSWAGD